VPLPPPRGLYDLSDADSGSAKFTVAALQKPGVWMYVRATSFKLLLATLRSLRPIG
jgi:hypothetical protein